MFRSFMRWLKRRSWPREIRHLPEPLSLVWYPRRMDHWREYHLLRGQTAEWWALEPMWYRSSAPTLGTAKQLSESPDVRAQTTSTRSRGRTGITGGRSNYATSMLGGTQRGAGTGPRRRTSSISLSLTRFNRSRAGLRGHAGGD